MRNPDTAFTMFLNAYSESAAKEASPSFNSRLKFRRDFALDNGVPYT
jgi:hypothetical protein